MELDSGDWEEKSSKDSSDFEAAEYVVDPILELIADLAICYQALAEHCGRLCTDCTCPLGYHIPCDSGECEFCGCFEVRRVCADCGVARVLEMYMVGSPSCKFCVDHPPIKILHPARPKIKEGRGDTRSAEAAEWINSRAKAARMALKELTE